MAAALALNSSDETEMDDLIFGIGFPQPVIPERVAYRDSEPSRRARSVASWKSPALGLTPSRRDDIAYFLPSPGIRSGSTGPPASFQALKPPRMWATGLSPMSCAVLAASAERRPPAQKNTNFLSSPKIGLK